MSRDSTILQGRAFTEAMMTSTCTIARAVADPTLNEQTGNYEPTSQAIYSGPCKIKFGGTQANTSDAAGQLLTEQSAILSIPVAATGSGDVETDDVATITFCDLDPALVGKVFRVTGLHTQTAATARRLSVEIIS